MGRQKKDWHDFSESIFMPCIKKPLNKGFSIDSKLKNRDQTFPLICSNENKAPDSGAFYFFQFQIHTTQLYDLNF